MTARALMRPRRGGLTDVVFPPLQSDLFRVVAHRGYVELWCDGQHADWHDRIIRPDRGARLSDLFAVSRIHEERWHR